VTIQFKYSVPQSERLSLASTSLRAPLSFRLQRTSTLQMTTFCRVAAKSAFSGRKEPGKMVSSLVPQSSLSTKLATTFTTLNLSLKLFPMTSVSPLSAKSLAWKCPFASNLCIFLSRLSQEVKSEPIRMELSSTRSLKVFSDFGGHSKTALSKTDVYGQFLEVTT
jgi:hypothetical protein